MVVESTIGGLSLHSQSDGSQSSLSPFTLHISPFILIYLNSRFHNSHIPSSKVPSSVRDCESHHILKKWPLTPSHVVDSYPLT